MTTHPVRAMSSWIRLTALLLGAVVAVWGLVGSALAVALPQTPVWTMLGFEAVVASAGVLGLLTGLGFFRSAPALALACVGGTVLVASFLGHRGTGGILGTMSLQSWSLARIAVGLALSILAALAVLTRRRASWNALLTGAAFGALPAALCLMVGLSSLGYGRPLAPPPDPAALATTVSSPPTPRSPAALDNAVRKFWALPIFKAQKGGLEAGRVVLLMALGIALIGLTSAGTHYVVKAFQLGEFPDPGAAPNIARAGSPA